MRNIHCAYCVYRIMWRIPSQELKCWIIIVCVCLLLPKMDVYAVFCLFCQHHYFNIARFRVVQQLFNAVKESVDAPRVSS